ncbi:hypothetical protein [Microbacterium trichothecenolyticum]|uniref:Uncharacterized protein n=1 Tax=Microbacterium trichothecenolyticum TaxID=69370 RepID=A0ABU0TT02_MICTR|nr:hypothetical protein [Microbacterium trichothecenolyticum]MDQ1122800.1 hypothetical protein [Microbacterium trichothecenolyticum]
MSLDTVQNFFRLTLDNVYRFVCALFFLLAISAGSEGVTPLQQTARLLSWLAIPADWLGVVEAWLGERSDALINVSTLGLFIAFCACLTESWLSRAGATVLLAIGFLIQAGAAVQFLWTVGTLAAGLAVGIVAVSAVRRRLGFSATSWLSPVFSRLQNLAPSLFLALLGAFGPLMWLVGEDRARAGETRSTPVHVSQVN